MRFLKLLPVQLAFCIALALTITPFVSTEFVAWAYSLSAMIKDLLMFILPVVVFSYLTAALLSVEQKAPLLILSIVVLVGLSNGLAAFAAYGVGSLTLPFLIGAGGIHALQATQTNIQPLFALNLPQWLAPDRAMLVGIAVGLVCTMWRHPTVSHTLLTLRNWVNLVLRKGLTPALPVYVFGFVLKLSYEGTFSILFKNYAQILVLTFVFFIAYISLMYWIGSGFDTQRFTKALKNMAPAGLTGFCTMSSAATLPVTLEETEKNLKNRNYAQLVIPSTVNIHLQGDALGLPLLGMAILMAHGAPLPGFIAYASFVLYFCLAKYSTAGIPGGGVLVLLPVLEKYLGLSTEMLGMITTLYILQDSFFTSANVMGNGAFAMVTERILAPFMKSLPKPHLHAVTTEDVKENLRRMRKTG